MELIGMTAALVFARAFSSDWPEWDRFLFTVLCLGAMALALVAVRF